LYNKIFPEKHDLSLESLKSQLSIYKDIINIDLLFYELKLWQEREKNEFDIYLLENHKNFIHILINFFRKTVKKFFS